MKKERIIMDSPIPGMDTLAKCSRELKRTLEQDEGTFERRILADIDSLVFADNGKTAASAAEWIVEHESFLMSLCKRYSWVGEKDDLYQEACLAIIGAFGTYDPHQYDVKDTTYYWVCAANGIRKVYRESQAKRRQSSPEGNMKFFAGPATMERDEDGVVALVCGSAEDSLMETESCDFWMRAINRLPEKQREAMLWTIKGLTQVEVAEKLGMSQASVSGFLKEARRTLSALRKAVA